MENEDEKQVSYKKRIADDLLEEVLTEMPAVQIVGPKWCGKTTTAERAAKGAIYLQDPDWREEYYRLAKEKPSLLLAGEKPLLLDEWQDVPVLWDAVRFATDKKRSKGQYILTGSTVPPKDEIKHPGTGRFARIKMNPMSLFESGESSGEASLTALFNNKDIAAKTKTSLEDIAFSLVRGGWPAAVVQKSRRPQSVAKYYCDSIIEDDISRVDDIEKNPKRVRLLMRSLARNESTEASLQTLQSDMEAFEGKISTNTMAVYLNALRRLFVIDEQEAWVNAVRAKTPIRTSSKRRFCDPSIAAAMLGLTPKKLLVDFNTFGLLFESLCIRDLKVYAQKLGGQVSHYRDALGLECDAILELADGRWGAIEIKLGTSGIESAVKNLTKLKKNVKSQHGGSATFLMILTTGGFAYRGEDGIYIVPISLLGV